MNRENFEYRNPPIKHDQNQTMFSSLFFRIV